MTTNRYKRSLENLFPVERTEPEYLDVGALEDQLAFLRLENDALSDALETYVDSYNELLANFNKLALSVAMKNAGN